ncbi:hypothetical protein [Granulicella tundricola]|nr:hypothetical protein [Granulicella tundricola]
MQSIAAGIDCTTLHPNRQKRLPGPGLSDEKTVVRGWGTRCG